jgi:amidase
MNNTSSSLTLYPATRLLDLLKTRQISAVELLELHLERLSRLNPALNVIVDLDIEGARHAAQEADATLARGAHVGPLCGLPMTIKDAWEVTGLRATCGIPPLAQHRPTIDADAVARLRAAGAVLFGKTNVPTGAGDHQSYNPVYGRSNNPWNPDRTVGGSSGGAAGALAAGLTPLELGSDIGGSIRCPAHFCGVYGHKPSYGVVPMRGHIPPDPGGLLSIELGVGGPLARSASDLELALDILAAPVELERAAWSIRLPPSRHERLADFRVAVLLDRPPFATDSRCLAAIGEYAQDLRRLGVRVDERARPDIDFEKSHALYAAVLFSVFGGGWPSDVVQQFIAAAAGLPADDESWPARVARALRMPHAQFMGLAERREHLFRTWRRFFQQYDLLLCPVMPTVAFAHDTTGDEFGHIAQFKRTMRVDGIAHPYMDGLQWPGVATVANLPATVVPTGRLVEGLPVGAQLIGPYLEDRTALRFAALAERELVGFQPPPGYAGQ